MEIPKLNRYLCELKLQPCQMHSCLKDFFRENVVFYLFFMLFAENQSLRVFVYTTTTILQNFREINFVSF